MCVWSVGVGCGCVYVEGHFNRYPVQFTCSLSTHIHVYCTFNTLITPSLTHTQVGDIAHAVGSIISDSATAGKTYELAG